MRPYFVRRVSWASVGIGAAGLWAAVALAAPTSAAAADPKTERLYRAKCASCHGEDGKGQTEQGQKMGIRDLTTSSWQKEFTDEQITKVTLEGFKRNKAGKAQEMEPFKDKLRPEQLPPLVAYLRALAK